MPGWARERHGGAPAADRDRDVLVGVLVEDDLAVARVGERARGDRVVAVGGELELDLRPRHCAELLDVAPRQVQLHVPESVDVEAARADAPRADVRLRHLEPDERVGLHRGAELTDVEPPREVCRRRREDIAAVEGRGHRLERVLPVRDLVRRLDAAELLGRRHEQAVVRPHIQPPVRPADGDLSAIAADSWVDDREVHALGQVRQRVREHERALEDALRLDPVRDVDDLDLGRDPLHHAVAGSDEVVLEPEVGQERDQHVRATVTNRPRRRGRRGHASSPGRRPRGRPRVPPLSSAGPIVTAGMSTPSAANERAAEPDASTTTSPSGGPDGRRSRVR